MVGHPFSGTTLNWSASTVGTGCTLTSYTVYQDGTVIATTTTTYAVTGLSPSTTYSFTVAASDSFGTSAQGSPGDHALQWHAAWTLHDLNYW